MTHSDSPDFEFDISDLEVEGNDPSASEQGTDASTPERDPDSGERSQLPSDEVVGPKSASEESAEEGDSDLSGFDIDSLPDAFSSPLVVAPADPATAELQPVQPMESGAENRSMREMGADDLGADVFAEIDGEDEVASFEDVLEDLMEQVDDFEAGGFVDLDEETEQDAANRESEDGVLGLEDPDDSLSRYVDPNADSPQAKSRESVAQPATVDASMAPKPRPKLPPDFEIPADPEGEAADLETVLEAAPALADAENEQDPSEADDLAGAVVSAYEALEDADSEDNPDDEEFEEDERVNVVEESPVLVDDEEEAVTGADARDSETEDVDRASGEALGEIEEPFDEEAEVPLSESESPLPESAQGSGLQMLDHEEDEEETGEPTISDSGPGMAILDEDEDELPSEPDPEGGAGDSPEDVDVDEAEEDDEVVAMPSAEDLLMRAGNIFNGDKPAHAASSMLSDSGDDEEEAAIAEMPSLEDLMAEAVESDGDAVSMPDSAGMMKMAAGGLGPADEDDNSEKAVAEDESAPVSGNVADRGGDLPPPPPAPVEIIDDDPMDEDESAPEPMADLEPLAPGPAPDDFQDSFESEISLDDFDESFDGSDDMSDVFPDELDVAGGFDEDSDRAVAVKGGDGGNIVAMPKLGILWRVTHSIAVAAAVFAIAAGWVFAIWKQEIMEYVDGRDIDGSALIMQIRQVGSHALQDFDEFDLYRMQWVDSEVRRVSDNEIRIHALVGAQLRENLYEQVFDSELEKKFGYDDAALSEAMEYAGDNFPEEIGRSPEKPWSNLYRLSAAKSEVLPLRIAYRLTRQDAKSDWELTGIKARGYEKDEIEWPEGQPARAFGDRAYDIDSVAFEQALADYREKADAYTASISNLRYADDEKLASLHVENQKRRERVMMSLSQGSFFRGVAIVGEDAAIAENVTMVITEIRENGALVKGVFQMDQRTDDYSKFFVGSIDFEAVANGSEQGVLNVRTVAMSDAPADDSESAFFDPQTVSRMRLETDGFRLEGDMRDLSLRLTRNM